MSENTNKLITYEFLFNLFNCLVLPGYFFKVIHVSSLIYILTYLNNFNFIAQSNVPVYGLLPIKEFTYFVKYYFIDINLREGEEWG